MTEPTPRSPRASLALRETSSSLLPAAIARMGDQAARAFVEFFTAQIRNANTREAYHRNVTGFLGWLERRGVLLASVRAFHVAAYIEELGRPAEDGGRGYAAPTVKQHLAAIRMLGAFLVVRQVIPANPALDVRGPKHVVTVGKTPVLAGEDARRLLNSIETDTPIGLRDRAILGVMVYTFGRVSAVVGLDIDDYYQNGRRMFLRLREKGGRQHEMPAHHSAVEYLEVYLNALGEKSGPLFRTMNRRRDGYTERRIHRREVLAMVKRRCAGAGLGGRFTNHTFRATGITAYLKNGGQLEHAQIMAAHASPRTTKLYDRRAQKATLDEVERIVSRAAGLTPATRRKSEEPGNPADSNAMNLLELLLYGVARYGLVSLYEDATDGIESPAREVADAFFDSFLRSLDASAGIQTP